MTREEAIAIISRPFDMSGVPSEISNAHKMAVEALEQEPKTGHWIEDDCGEIECDRCHREFSIFNNDTEKFNYCPWCGARMNGKEEE